MNYPDRMREESFYKLSCVYGDIKELRKVMIEIEKDSDNIYQVISYMDELYHICLWGEEMNYEKILSFWKCYKDTFQCNGEAFRMAFNVLKSEIKDKFKKIYDFLPWWRKLLYKISEKIKMLFNR